MSQPLRFLHASDLRLERPLGGLTEIPPHWRTLCSEAPRRAAARAFELARQERCEFVVLSGDVVDPELAGLRLLRWLNEEFDRLAEAGVRVYWSGGRSDAAARWPRGWKFPQNVVRFRGAKPSIEMHVDASGRRLALCGCGASLGREIAPGRWTGAPKHAARVFVAHGRVPLARMKDTGHDYWALGGRSQPRRHAAGRALWRYCGTIQARSPREASPHGVSLVEWDGGEQFSLRAVACDAVRYRVEHLTVAADSEPAEIEQQMRQRIELAAQDAGRPLIIWWRLQGPASSPRHGNETLHNLLSALRLTPGAQAWSAAVDWTPADALATERPEDTAAAGFLRELRECLPLERDELGPRLAALGAPAAESIFRHWRQASRRRQWLNDAARLGLELLDREPIA